MPIRYRRREFITLIGVGIVSSELQAAARTLNLQVRVVQV
jgi:hypothetical protein